MMNSCFISRGGINDEYYFISFIHSLYFYFHMVNTDSLVSETVSLFVVPLSFTDGGIVFLF